MGRHHAGTGDAQLSGGVRESMVVVLVSVGRHPVSGRPRRALNDAKAVQLAWHLAQACSLPLRVLHAGSRTQEAALRAYLGMGPQHLDLIEVPADADVAGALEARLTELRPLLVVTGIRSEAGWSSGCLPYLLARRLDMALVPNADALGSEAGPADLAGDRLEVRQVLPRGRRRRLRVHLPALVTVDPAAPAPAFSAYARARRGRLDTILPPDEALRPAPCLGEAAAARRRPRRLLAAPGAGGGRTLDAILQPAPARDAALEAPASPDEAAQRVHDWLQQRGLLPGHR